MSFSPCCNTFEHRYCPTAFTKYFIGVKSSLDDAKNNSIKPLLVQYSPLKEYDSSYFMYGLSCLRVGFQSGNVSSSTSNINFKFGANIVDIPSIDGHNKMFRDPVIVMFLIDAEIIIQVLPNAGHPVVEVNSRSLV